MHPCSVITVFLRLLIRSVLSAPTKENGRRKQNKHPTSKHVRKCTASNRLAGCNDRYRLSRRGSLFELRRRTLNSLKSVCFIVASDHEARERLAESCRGWRWRGGRLLRRYVGQRRSARHHDWPQAFRRSRSPEWPFS